MAFNHDNFILHPNYLALDTSLDWYIGILQSNVATLEKLARYNPDKAKALFQRDSVMRKIYRIGSNLDKFKNLAKAAE